MIFIDKQDSIKTNEPYWLLGRVDADYELRLNASSLGSDSPQYEVPSPYRIFISSVREAEEGELEKFQGHNSRLDLAISGAVNLSDEAITRDRPGWVLRDGFDQLLIVDPVIRFFDDHSRAAIDGFFTRYGRVSGSCLVRRLPVVNADLESSQESGVRPLRQDSTREGEKLVFLNGPSKQVNHSSENELAGYGGSQNPEFAMPPPQTPDELKGEDLRGAFSSPLAVSGRDDAKTEVRGDQPLSSGNIKGTNSLDLLTPSPKSEPTAIDSTGNAVTPPRLGLTEHDVEETLGAPPTSEPAESMEREGTGTSLGLGVKGANTESGLSPQPILKGGGTTEKPYLHSTSNCLFCKPIVLVLVASLIYLGSGGIYASFYLLVVGFACILSTLLASIALSGVLAPTIVLLGWIGLIWIGFNVHQTSPCLINDHDVIFTLGTALLLLSSLIRSVWTRCISHFLWLILGALIWVGTDVLCSTSATSGPGTSLLSSENRAIYDGGSIGELTDFEKFRDLAKRVEEGFGAVISGDSLDQEVSALKYSDSHPIRERTLITELEGWFPSKSLCASDSGEKKTEVLYIGERAVFEENKKELAPGASQIARRLAGVLHGVSIASIEVVGHTRPSSKQDYNPILSLNRAISFRNLLLEFYGMPSQMISAYGVADRDPIFSTPGEESQLDNRLEIVIECK